MAIKLYMAINADNEGALKEFFEEEAFECVKENGDAQYGIPLKNGYVSCQYIKDENVEKNDHADLVCFQLDLKRYLRTGRMREGEKLDDVSGITKES